MKPFIAPNEDFIKSEKTKIATAVEAGSSVATTVDNDDGFSEDDYVIVGVEGLETTEIAKITAAASNVITLDTLGFAHAVDEPITKIAFNQRKLYGCATKTGTFIYIETKDIEVDNPKGTYFEYIGTAYDWFKATYYNEATAAETDIDDAVATQAGDVEHYCGIFAIREEAGFEDNPYISDGRIHNLRLQAESEVKGSVNSRYTLPLLEVPEVVKLATKLLAAGWLLYQEYGAEEGSAVNGIDKIKEARSLLKSIREGKIRLLDSNDTELSHKDEERADGWPDDTTKDEKETDSGGAIKFRAKKKF